MLETASLHQVSSTVTEVEDVDHRPVSRLLRFLVVYFFVWKVSYVCSPYIPDALHPYLGDHNHSTDQDTAHDHTTDLLLAMAFLNLTLNPFSYSFWGLQLSPANTSRNPTSYRAMPQLPKKSRNWLKTAMLVSP